MKKKIAILGIVSMFLLMCFTTVLVTAVEVNNKPLPVASTGIVIANIYCDEDLEQDEIDAIHRDLTEGFEWFRLKVQLEKCGLLVDEDVVTVNSIGSYTVTFENVEPSRIGNKYSIDIRHLFPAWVITKGVPDLF